MRGSDQLIFEITYDLFSNDALFCRLQIIYSGARYILILPHLTMKKVFFSINSVTTNCKFISIISKPVITVSKESNPAGKKVLH